MTSSKFIPLMVPDIQQQDIDAVVNVLKSGMLVQGTNVEALETTISDLLNAKHAIAVSNGTASLHLALVAMGIGKGDEVIVPAFSYIATANVVELVGATPVFVDIKLDSFNINAELIERAITSKTKAVIPVHEFGLACDISAIQQIAKKHNLKIIEDAACALGATENKKYVGTFGDVGSFSFHPRKAITSGEGGILVTNDDELAKKLRILRNHGIEMQNGKMEFVLAGFNYRMTDFQAAMLNSQIKRLADILKIKTEYAAIYLSELNSKKILLPSVPENKNHTWQSFHIILDDEINRDDFIQLLKENNIGSNYGAQCIPCQQFYQNKYALDCEKLFPNSMKAYKQGIAIPLYEKLTANEIHYIISKIKTLV